jgi:hypothetical protein
MPRIDVARLARPAAQVLGAAIALLCCIAKADGEAPSIVRGHVDDGVCAPPDDGLRLAWSVPLPTGSFVLDAIDIGRDGCLALSLHGVAQPWFLCVSEDALPFAVGDAIAIESVYAAGLEGVRLFDESRQLVVTRGASTPAIDDVQWSIEPMPACEVAVEPTCGTVGRAMRLRVQSEAFGDGVLRGGGDPLRLRSSDGRTLRIESAAVHERVAFDPECAFGPDAAGMDIELAVTTEVR